MAKKKAPRKEDTILPVEPAKDPTPQETQPIGLVDDSGLREEATAREIKEILLKHNCGICVTTLDIRSGRVFPRIQIVAK